MSEISIISNTKSAGCYVYCTEWDSHGERHARATQRPPTKKRSKSLKKAGLLTRKYRSKGYTILTQDECSTIVGYSGATGWLLKGAKINVSSSLSSKRFYTIGVLGEGVEYHTFAEKANSETFVDFIKQVHAKFGKVLIFLDNASYHKSCDVKEGLEEFGKDVILEYLLPYAPETNPSEGQWKIQKQHTSNRGYEDVEEMQESINRMYRTGEIKLAKMHDYLRDVECT